MKTVVLLSKVFFEGHPKAGQPTNFAKSVKDGCKRHTVRSNYAYWEKKIAALKKARRNALHTPMERKALQKPTGNSFRSTCFGCWYSESSNSTDGRKPAINTG